MFASLVRSEVYRSRTLTIEEDLSIANGVGHVRERGDVGGGVRLEDYKVSIEASSDAAAVGRVSVSDVTSGIGHARQQEEEEHLVSSKN